MQDDPIVRRVQFDPKVKVYWYMQGLIANVMMMFGIVGFVTTPLWLLGGWWLVNRRYDALSAELTTSAIHLRYGIINRIEKSIPLEKIQDVGLRSGPLLRAFGLASVSIETAGGGAQQGADMTLAGIVDAETFRNTVLVQRKGASRRDEPAVARRPDASVALLTEIRDSLARIDARLARVEAREKIEDARAQTPEEV